MSGPALAEDAATDSAAQVLDAVTGATGTEDVIDSSAGDADSAVTTSTAASAVDIPRDPAVGISITTAAGDSFVLGLPGDGDRATTTDGTVVYTGVDEGVAAAAQATDNGGVRVLVSIADDTAAHDYRFPLDLPEGATASLADGGVVNLTGAVGEDL